MKDIVLLVAGALLGWGISHLYYIKAKHDSDEAATAQIRILTDHNAMLQDQNRMLTTALTVQEEQGLVKLNRDAQGKITGRQISLEAHAEATSSSGAELTTSPKQ